MTTTDTPPPTTADAIHEAFDNLETRVDIHEGRIENVEYAAEVLQEAVRYATAVFSAAKVDQQRISTRNTYLSGLSDLLETVGVPSKHIPAATQIPASAIELAEDLAAQAEAKADPRERWFFDATLQALLSRAGVDTPSMQEAAEGHLGAIGWITCDWTIPPSEDTPGLEMPNKIDVWHLQDEVVDGSPQPPPVEEMQRVGATTFAYRLAANAYRGAADRIAEHERVRVKGNRYMRPEGWGARHDELRQEFVLAAQQWHKCEQEYLALADFP